MPTPNFFIIGNPKCGTTSLATWLSSNDDIFMSSDKEPHFYATDMHDRSYRSRDEYDALFAGRAEAAIGEASVWYAISDTAVRNILEESPNARFIYCLRNPVDMAWALHNQMIQVGNEDILDFQNAWELRLKRRGGQSVPKKCLDARKLDYERSCCHGGILGNLCELIPEKNLHIIFLEDMAKDPSLVVRGVEKFLGVPFSDMEVFPVENEAFQRKSPALSRLIKAIGRLKGKIIKRRMNLGILSRIDLANRTVSRRPKMPSDIRSMLISSFKYDIAKLEKLTGRDLSYWMVINDE